MSTLGVSCSGSTVKETIRTPSVLARSFCNWSKSALIRGQPVQQRVKRNDATQTLPRRSFRVMVFPLCSVSAKSATAPRSSAGDEVSDSIEEAAATLGTEGFPFPAEQPERDRIGRIIPAIKLAGSRRTETSSRPTVPRARNVNVYHVALLHDARQEQCRATEPPASSPPGS